jgi:hypothetical protein
MWSHQDLAEQQGVRMPMESFNDHYLASLDIRGMARPPHPPQAQGMWARLVSDSERWPGTSLISHELFAAAGPVQAKRATSSFGPGTEVHVVLTARDLLRQLSAEWQEHVKHRSSLRFDEFVTSVRADAAERSGWFWRVQDYVGVLDRWGAGLPASQVHVITVPPSGAPQTLLWERFAGLLGLDPATFDTEGSRSNTSLGLEQAELLRRVNVALGDRLPLPGPYPGTVKEVLAHRVLAARHGNPLRLTPEDIGFAADESRKLAEGLAAAGVDVIGSLDDLLVDEETVARAAAQGYQPPPDSELLDESVHVLADLLVDIAAERQRDRASVELGEAVREDPVRTALKELAEHHPALGRIERTLRRLRDRS